jgi:F-type H+-transporting ATPase subunit b
MPQINQLSEIFFSQLFWLLVVFGILYFGIARGMVSKVQSTVDLRDRTINDDLEAAQQARDFAERTEEAWRARMDASRGEAAKVTQEAKQASARQTEEQVRAASQEITAKLDSATVELRQARTSALAEIEAVAAEATREMVERLTGKPVQPGEAAAAVKAELHV